jgi:hypothetical protein
MASVAPSRFCTNLEFDPATSALIEKRVYWPETHWIPASVLGTYVTGDQTTVAATGAITFLDCHVLPGSAYVYPFGDWSVDTVGGVATTVEFEEHSADGTRSVIAVVAPNAQGVYYFPVTAGTRRVCTAPV